MEKLYELTQGEAYITTEVGQNQMWAAQFYKFKQPRRLMTSGGLGVMGYGFPAAMGVQVAKPDAIVIDIAGDGSIQMNIQELITVVDNNLPVKIAILNNTYLGMVRQWQQLFYDRRYSFHAHDGARFCQAGRSLRRGGAPGHQARGSGAGHPGGPQYPPAGDHGLQGGTGRMRHAHGARGQGHARDVAGLRRGKMDLKMEPRHTIAVWVDNTSGVLSRVTGLFSGRGFNIESLCVAETMDPEVSRITIVSTGDEQITEQIIKQLHKLINIIKVVDLSELEHVEREMVLVRVKAEDKSRAEVLRIADIFRCRVVDVSASTYTLEITGNHDKIRAVLDLLKNHGIQEVARTGTLAIQRSKKE